LYHPDGLWPLEIFGPSSLAAGLSELYIIKRGCGIVFHFICSQRGRIVHLGVVIGVVELGVFNVSSSEQWYLLPSVLSAIYKAANLLIRSRALFRGYGSARAKHRWVLGCRCAKTQRWLSYFID